MRKIGIWRLFSPLSSSPEAVSAARRAICVWEGGEEGKSVTGKDDGGC